MKEKAFIISAKTFDGKEKKAPLFVPIPEAGVDMPSYEDLAAVGNRITITEKRVTNLEKGVAADNFVTDDSVAYVKSVPANSAPYAAISKVGGMTHRVNTGTEEAPVYELRHAAVTEIEVVGSNVANFKDTAGGTSGGVTWSCQNGAVTVSGTATGDSYSNVQGVKANLPIASGLIYKKIAYDVENVSTVLRVVRNGSTTYISADTSYTVVGDETVIDLYFYVKKGNTAEATFYPCMTSNGTALPYTPYRSWSYPIIPESVQALDGYGWGIDGEYNNHVAYEDGRRTWNYRVVKKVFDGTESWTGETSLSGTVRSYYNYKIGALGTIVDSVSVCNKFATIPILTSSNSDVGCRCFNSTARNGAIFACRPENAASMTTTLMKELVKSWYDAGDPLVVYYVLATPVVTDISDILPADNLIEVEGGGTITFDNEHSLAVPSEVIYQTKGAAV